MVSSRDVARMAGVSQATVSRVLQGNSKVRPENARAVRDALARSGYIPNANARAMRTNRTGSIGVVTGKITNPFYPELIQAISASLTDAGQYMVLWDGDSGGERAAVNAIRAGTVDGLLFTTATEESAALHEALARNLPIVLVNRSLNIANCDQITSNNIAGGRHVADYFLKHGHTRLGIVSSSHTISTGRERRQGFVERLRERGSEIPDDWSPRVDFSHDAGRQAGLSVLAQQERPTALFCVNDLLAFGVFDAARSLRIDIPNELWVAGYDDVAMASWDVFDLTTIKQPVPQMGKAAVDRLLSRIHNPDGPIEHLQFRDQLVIRGSTANAPWDAREDLSSMARLADSPTAS
jgi:LacI family transcriptional regulator